MAGIYLHIPFCRKACHYCDFHFSTTLKHKTEIVQAMVKELEARAVEFPYPLETIYLGGGTPSLLNEAELQSIFSSIAKHYNTENVKEITVEVNPDDVTYDKLQAFQSVGVNRLSIGVQTFNDPLLQLLNRAHDSRTALNAIELATKSGIKNISIDLIFGLPQSSHVILAEDLERIVQLDIPHFSAYMLTIEEKTVLHHWIAKQQMLAPTEDFVLEQFMQLMSFAANKGYEQYEISNYGKPGIKGIHNSNYWEGKPYLGIGPSAHSYQEGIRRWNVSNNAKYTRGIATGEEYFTTETLTNNDQFNEAVMLGLRKREGIDLQELKKRFGQVHYESAKAELANWDKSHYIQQGENVALTQEGKKIADALIATLFQVEQHAD